MRLNNMPCIEADDILVFVPNSGLNKWANTISGSFTYPSGQKPCSIMINKGVDVFSSSCHAWLGFPETVLYRYTDGSFGIGKFKSTSEIPNRSKVLWAVGGMGLLDKYNPSEEGFSRFTKNGKTYNYSDVLRLTSHTMIGVKDGKCYLVYIPSMTGKQVNDYAFKCGFEKAVMLDGGHISAMNSKDFKANLNTIQGYVIQGINKPVKKKLIIDMGHSDLVIGKQSPDKTYNEYEFNIDIGNRMDKILQTYPLEVVLVDYRHANATVELVNLIEKINEEKADICVSIHSNGYGDDFNSANGWEAFYYDDPKYPEGKKLAEALRKRSLVLGLTDRGIKPGNHLAIVRDTEDMATVLIETGFHTNREDLAKLKDNSFRDLVAKTYCQGILDYFGIEWVEPSTTTLYKVQVGSFAKKEAAILLQKNLKAAGFDSFIKEETK